MNLVLSFITVDLFYNTIAYEVNAKERQLIVNGVEVDPPRKYSWMVFSAYECGLTLIAPNVLLTAAHCVDIDKAYISLGVHNIYDYAGEIKDRENYYIDEYVRHPSFSSSTFDYDFMVMKMNGFSNRTPIVLDDGSNELSDGTELITIGWGHTYYYGTPSNILREVEIDYMNNSHCSNKYQDFRSITDQMFCAGRTVGDTTYDSCTGDSGGPIIRKSDGKQVGIASWGRECANPNYPGVYSRISSAYDWIQTYIDKWHLNSNPPSIKPEKTYKKDAFKRMGFNKNFTTKKKDMTKKKVTTKKVTT